MLSLIGLLIVHIVSRNVLEGANILVHLPSHGRSHSKPFEPLFVELARRGHNITTIGVHPPQRRVENYTHLQVSPDISMGIVEANKLQQQYRLENYVYIHDALQTFIVQFANETHTRNVLRSGVKWDLVMVEVYHFDTFFALAGPSNTPIIGISFQPLLPVYHWMMKNPCTFSYVPHLYLPYSDRMNFVQRTINAAFSLFTILFYNFVSLPKYQRQINQWYETLNFQNAPTIEDLTRNLSLIFVESHFSVGYVKPSLPNVVEVAGIHIPPASKLPQNIENFMNNSANGVIYVSLGTNIDPNAVPHYSAKFIEIFEKLPYNIIWKWNPNLVSRLPKNVLLQKWLPQTDILSHPKLKLFVSHGGYHSIVETVNAGVPILCLPFFTDQYHNAAIVKRLGIGEHISIDSSQQQYLDAINGILNDESYQKNAKLRSNIFQDRPMSPLDQAVYWTEYVIRHKGTRHLQSAATELYWYQYLMLDVICLFVATAALLIYTLKKFLSYLSKLLTSPVLKSAKKTKSH